MVSPCSGAPMGARDLALKCSVKVAWYRMSSLQIVLIPNALSSPPEGPHYLNT